MPSSLPQREIVFLINDVGRMMRTLADHEARRFGMTRAQWAVLSRLERQEGLKQSELAEILDIQPITLTRLIDRMAENGLIERRSDPNDRRAKRLYLTDAAKPVLDRLSGLGRGLMSVVLDGTDAPQTEATLKQLEAMKENLRRALQARDETSTENRKYG